MVAYSFPFDNEVRTSNLGSENDLPLSKTLESIDGDAVKGGDTDVYVVMLRLGAGARSLWTERLSKFPMIKAWVQKTKAARLAFKICSSVDAMPSRFR